MCVCVSCAAVSSFTDKCERMGRRLTYNRNSELGGFARFSFETFGNVFFFFFGDRDLDRVWNIFAPSPVFFLLQSHETCKITHHSNNNKNTTCHEFFRCQSLCWSVLRKSAHVDWCGWWSMSTNSGPTLMGWYVFILNVIAVCLRSHGYWTLQAGEVISKLEPVSLWMFFSSLNGTSFDGPFIVKVSVNASWSWIKKKTWASTRHPGVGIIMPWLTVFGVSELTDQLNTFM